MSIINFCLRASFLLTLLLFSCGSTKISKSPTPDTQEKGIHFLEDISLTEAIKLAKKENKAIFINISTEWCAPCKLMEEEVYSDPNVADFYNKNFVNVKADGDNEIGKKLAFLFKAKSYPTFVFTDHRGRALLQHTGGTSLTKFLGLGEKALSKFNDSQSS